MARTNRKPAATIPLTPFLTCCFISEIAQQCRFALLAIEDLRALMQQRGLIEEDLKRIEKLFVTPEVARAVAEGRPFTGYTETTYEQRQQRRALAHAQQNEALARRASTDLRIWYSFQALLDATAIISKCLWGNKTETNRERQPLRDALGVTDDSPLFDRQLRDHSEHIDDKLVREFKKPGVPQHYFGRTVGEKRVTITPPPAVPAPQLHEYNPDTGTLSLLGFTVLVPALEAAVRRLEAVTGPAWISASEQLSDSLGIKHPR